MSKKAKLYLLIIINFIAWGYVGYRIYGALQGDDDVAFEESNLSIKKISEDKKEDSVVLMLNYTDPFLKGGNYSKENRVKATSHTISSNNQTSKTVQVNQPKKIEAPVANLDIKYVGLIKNSDKGTQTAMISINGKSYFVKVKDIIEGITILEISNTQLKLKSKNSIFYITK